MSSIANNIHMVQQHLSETAKKYNRNSEEITLLAVSKTRPVDDIKDAYLAGLRHFGENYLQESLEKIDTLKSLNICWHFIGPLQSNKTRAVAENFHWLHTVARFKIGQRLSDQRPPEMPPLNICVQVNISEEESKSGCSVAELPKLIEQLSQLPNIIVRGLMAIPTATDNTELQRKTFAQMKQLLLELQQNYPHLDTLSMGMSGDMAAAVAEGSTMVRIGTAIFGPRAPKTAQ